MLCFACQCSFTDNKALVSHIRSYHGHLSVFRCEERYCQKQFSSFSSFRNHRSLKHVIKSHHSLTNHHPDTSTSTIVGTLDNSIAEENLYNFMHEIGDDSDDYNSVDFEEEDFEEIHVTDKLKVLDSDAIYNPRKNSRQNSSDLNHAIKESALQFISKLYSFPEISRNRVLDIMSETSTFVRQIINMTLEHIEQHTELSNVDDHHLKIIADILSLFSDPFNNVHSEWQHFKNFKKRDTLILPESHTIGERHEFKKENDSTILKTVKVTIEFVPMRKVFSNFFNMPGVLQETLDYMESLKSCTNVVSNFCQGSLWKSQSSSFIDKIVLPLFMYFDDYETNNPLGSHKGISKCGAVYLSLPSLPPIYQSKIENIFLFSLFNSLDREQFKNEIIFTRIVEELYYLRNTGITIDLPTGPVHLFFQLSLILGDNLGLHSILGFSEGFNTHFFCRFCLTRSSDIENIFHESQCNLRDVENYEELLKLNDLSKSGIKEQCVFHKDIGFHVTENQSVDVMHDILEGVCATDIALILNHFIYDKKFFTLEELNNRIQGFHYGDNHNKNKPAEILPHHLRKTKRLAMTSSEMLNFVRHVCMILACLVPSENEHWHQLKWLKTITEIVVSNIHPTGSHNYLCVAITTYLQFHVKLFPGSMRPKHHFLIHYPRILEKVGILWKISSMRYESKHREGKIIARAAISRVNVCHTIAFRHQLRLNHRFLFPNSYSSTYDCGSKKNAVINDILRTVSFSGCLPPYVKDPIFYTNWVKFRGDKITKHSIIMIPCEEGPTFHMIKLILIYDNDQLLLITKQIDDCYFDKHTQSFKIITDIFNEWVCLTYDDLKNAIVTYTNMLSDGFLYIAKLWI